MEVVVHDGDVVLKLLYRGVWAGGGGGGCGRGYECRCTGEYGVCSK
jgi:hypothetical protein